MAKNPEVKVKFSVFNKEFNNGMREMGKESTNLRKEFKLKEEQLKHNGSESDRLKNRVNYLSKEHELAKQKVKATEEQLAKAKVVYGENSNEVHKLNEKLIDAQLKEQRFANELADANRLLAVQEDKVRKVSQALDETGQKMMDTGGKMTKGVTLPLVAAGGAATKFAIDQEEAFAKVSTLLEGSAKDMDEYRDNIRNASSDMRTSFGEYSEAVYQSISAGVDQAEAIKFTNESVKLAKGGFTSTATAVDTLTGILNSYNLETSETENISNMLIMTQNRGKTTVDELGKSLGNVIPVASDLGIEYDQVGAAIATLTSQNIDTAKSTTALRNIFSDLDNSGSRLGKTFQKVAGKDFRTFIEEGGSIQEAIEMVKNEADSSGQSIAQLAGKENVAAFNVLANSTDQFSENLADLRESAGATDEAFEKVNNTTGAKLRGALIKAQNAAAKFGDVIAPVVSKVADVIERVTDRISNMSDRTKTIIVVVGAVLAAIGPLLIGLGFILKTVGAILPILTKLGAVFKIVKVAMLALTGPIGLIVAAIAGVIAIFVVLYQRNETFREKVNEVWNFIKDLITTVIDAVVSFVMNIFGGFVAFWQENQELIMESARMVWQFISSFIMGILDYLMPYIITTWTIIKTQIQIIWEYIKMVIQVGITFVQGIIKAVMQLITGDWKGAWETIKGTFIKIWEIIKGFISNIINIIKNNLSQWLNSLRSMIGDRLEFIKNIFSNIWNGIKDIVSSVVSSIHNTVQSRFEQVKNAIINPIETAKNTVKRILDNIKGFFTNLKLNIPTPSLPKLPKFGLKTSSRSILGKEITYPSGFDVTWHKTGGVFVDPVIAGNAGFGDVEEAIVPFEGSHAMKIAKLIAEAQAKLNNVSNGLADKVVNNIVSLNIQAGDVIMDGRSVGRVTWEHVKEFSDRDASIRESFRG